MKMIGFTSTALLFLVLAVTAPAYARQERQAEKPDRPEQQQHQGKQEQAKPQPQHAQQKPQAQNKPPQQAKQQNAPNQGHPQAAKQQARPKQNNAQQAKATPHRAPQAQHAQQAAWTQHRTGSWQSAHRTWQQRGGYNGYRIPQDRFGGYFGPDHGFRIYGLPFQTVGGYPRFQYQGYWLSLVDPWPSNWANNWYDTDNVYVSYDNGYYLYDTRYPGVGLAISVSN
jgi:hypothetical protein